MYTLSDIPGPADAIRGDLNGKGEGVVGVRSGRDVIELFPGALQAMQRILAGEQTNAYILVARSTTFREEARHHVATSVVLQT